VSFFSKVLDFFTLRNALVYYGKDLDYQKASRNDYIIIQPDYIDTNESNFLKYRDKMYAYISVCEISPYIKEYKKIDKDWILSENENWGSLVLDITNKEYQEFLFKEMIEPRLSLGFKNFFFDTLDSYQLVCKSDTQREKYKIALIEFITLFHQTYPTAKLIINRGFEIIESIYNYVEAILFESYYFGLGSQKKPYEKVTDVDKMWLDIQIKKIQSYSLPIISLEYLEESDMDKAVEAIKMIRSKGMIPYVSNRELNIYGIH